MIIANGTICFRVLTNGELDDNGYLKPPTSISWSEAIPCQYVMKSMQLSASSESGTATKRSYEIYIENDDDVSRSEFVRLYDQSGLKIGDFQIQSFEMLEAVCQLRIIV